MKQYYRVMLGRKSIKEQIAEDDQSVEGLLIALEDDQKLRWALVSVPSISFLRYQVDFKLVKA
jgi:restriction system protein